MVYQGQKLVSTSSPDPKKFSVAGFPESFAPVATYARCMRESVKGVFSLATVSGYEGTIELFSNINYYSGYAGGTGNLMSLPALKIGSSATNAIGWATFVVGALSSEITEYYQEKHKKLSKQNTFNSGTIRKFKLEDGEFGPID